MLSCKTAAGLIDKKSTVKLSWEENIRLKVHKSMCDACRAYEKQGKIIDSILHTRIHSDNNNTPIIENKELQDKIISNI